MSGPNEIVTDISWKQKRERDQAAALAGLYSDTQPLVDAEKPTELPRDMQVRGVPYREPEQPETVEEQSASDSAPDAESSDKGKMRTPASLGGLRLPEGMTPGEMVDVDDAIGRGAATTMADLAEGLVELFPHHQQATNFSGPPEEAKWHAGNIAGAFNGFANSILALNEAVAKGAYRLRTGEGVSDDYEGFRVPDQGPTDTVTGNLSRGIMQFMIGFKGADKALAPVLSSLEKGAQAQFGSITLKSIFADILAFDPEEGRLADLIYSIPDDHPAAVLKTIVPEYLVSDEDDGQFRGRLKNALEGTAIGVPLDLLFLSLRGLKSQKKLKEAVEDGIEASEAAERGLVTETDDYLAVFDEYMPEFRVRPEPEPEAPRADPEPEVDEEAVVLDDLSQRFDEDAEIVEPGQVELEAIARADVNAPDDVAVDDAIEAGIVREETADIEADIDVQAEEILTRAEDDPEVITILADELDMQPKDVQRALDELYNGEQSEAGAAVLDAYRRIDAEDADIEADIETQSAVPETAAPELDIPLSPAAEAAVEGRNRDRLVSQLMYDDAKMSLPEAEKAADDLLRGAATATPTPATVPTAVDGLSITNLVRRAKRFAGREDAQLRYDDAVEDVAAALASMPPVRADEALREIVQFGSSAEKQLVEDLQARLARIRSDSDIKASRTAEVEDEFETDLDEVHSNLVQFQEAVEENLPRLLAYARASNHPALLEPLEQIQKLVTEEHIPEYYLRAFADSRAFMDAVYTYRSRVEATGDEGTLNELDELLEAEDFGLAETYLYEPDIDTHGVLKLHEVELQASEEAVNNLDAIASLLRGRDPELDAAIDKFEIYSFGPSVMGQEFAKIAAKIRRNLDELWDDMSADLRAKARKEDDGDMSFDGDMDLIQTHGALRELTLAFDESLRRYSRLNALMFARPDAPSAVDISNAKARVIERRQLRLAAVRALGTKDYIALEDAGRIAYADRGTVIDQGQPGEFVMGDQLAVSLPDGRTIINASVAKPEMMPGLMLHEAGIHSGLRDFLGDEGMDAILRSLDDLLDGRDADVAIALQRAKETLEQDGQLSGAALEAAAARRVRRSLPDNDRATLATLRAQTLSEHPSHIKEETLAYLVQYAPDNPLARRLIGAMKVGIARRYPKLIPHLRWTEGDYRQLAIASLKAQSRKARGMPFRYRENAEPAGAYSPTQMILEMERRQPRDLLGRPKAPLLLDETIQEIRLTELGNLEQRIRELEPVLRSSQVMEAIAAKHGGEALFEYGDLLDRAVNGFMILSEEYRLKQLLSQLEGLDLPVSVKASRGDRPRWEWDERLSDNENLVMKLMYDGFTLDEIVEEMDYPTQAHARSVKAHAMRKLGTKPNDHPEQISKRREKREEILRLAKYRGPDGKKLSSAQIAERINGMFPDSNATVGSIKATLSQERRAMRTRGEVPKFSRADDFDDTFDPFAAPHPYLNLDRIKGPDDLKREIQRLSEGSADAVAARVGKPRTLRQVEREAQSANAFQALYNRRKNKSLTDAEMLALRQLRDASAERIMEFTRRYNASPTPQGKLALHNALQLHRAIQAEVSGASAEAARMLGSLRILSGPNPQQRRQMEAAIARLGDEGNFDKLARDLGRLSDLQQLELDRLVRYSWKENVADASGAWFRAMILSAPITHTINFVGNTGMIVFDIAAHFTSGALARVVGDSEGAEMMMQAALKGKAVIDGIAHQFRYAKKHSQLMPFKQGFGLKFDDMGVSGRQVDVADRRAVTAQRWGASEDSVLGIAIDNIGAALNAPSGALGAADDFFKGINYMGELRAMAYRRASNEVKMGYIDKADMSRRIDELMDEPTDSMMAAAAKAAKDRTFTTDPGPALMRVLGLRRWMNGLGLPIGHYLLPFVITPANIMSYTFKSLPVTNLAFADVREALSRGGQDAWRARGQIAMGTTVLALAWQLASEGIVTGGGPTDPQARRAMQDNQGLGWAPYSIRIGGQSYQYDRFDPIGNLLAFGAEINEMTSNRDMTRDPDDEMIAIISGGAMRIGQSMLDKSYLTGVRDVMAALTDPARHDDTYFQRLITANVAPSGGAAARRVQDPFWRETTNTMDMIRNRLPYPFADSSKLPMEYDLLGRPKTYQSGLGEVYDSVVPFISRKIDPEPIDRELQRIGYWPSFLERSISMEYGGQRVSVSLKHQPEIYSRMSQLMGGDDEYGLPGLIPQLNELVNARGYDDLYDGPEPLEGSKAKEIQRIIRRHRTLAREIVRSEFALELQDLAKRQLERQLEYAAEQEAERGGEAAAEMIELLQSQ